MDAKLLKIAERLDSNPELIERVERILDVAENVDGSCSTADEAEARAIEEVRKLGQELMQRWLKNESLSHESQIPETYRRSGKKNSTGTAVLEK